LKRIGFAYGLIEPFVGGAEWVASRQVQQPIEPAKTAAVLIDKAFADAADLTRGGGDGSDVRAARELGPGEGFASD
jgi:hypothetical protein